MNVFEYFLSPSHAMRRWSRAWENIVPSTICIGLIALEFAYVWTYRGTTARPAIRLHLRWLKETIFEGTLHALIAGSILSLFTRSYALSYRRQHTIRRRLMFLSSTLWYMSLFLVAVWISGPLVLSSLLQWGTPFMVYTQLRFATGLEFDPSSDVMKNMQHNPFWTVVFLIELAAWACVHSINRFWPWHTLHLICYSTFCLYVSTERPPKMMSEQPIRPQTLNTTSSLCDACKIAVNRETGKLDVIGESKEIPHHFWKKDIRKSAENGCRICATLWEQWLYTPVSVLSWLVFWKPITTSNWTRSGKVLQIQTRMDLRDRSCRFLINKSALHDTDYEKVAATLTTAHTWSEPTLRLATRWLSDCSSGHGNCSSPLRDDKFHPTRLIRIEGQGEGVKIRLHVPGKSTTKLKYATLSHCWGRLGANNHLRLLQAYKTTWQSGIANSMLPKNFFQAIQLAAYLEFEYIWIDSLCIIQDDLADWQAEAPKMKLIYANSACNLAATDASDSSQGLFFPRNPRTLAPEPFESKNGRMYLLNDTDIHNHPLYARAWVMQELLLAPRTLHCGRGQLSWSCDALRASEILPNGILRTQTLQDNHPAAAFCAINSEGREAILNAQMLNHVFSSIVHYKTLAGDIDKSKFPTRGSRFEVRFPFGKRYFDLARLAPSPHPFDYWALLVTSYTGMQLTEASDRPVALAGIIALLEPHLGAYLAGVWRIFLPMELLWRTKVTSRRATKYRAPSWSWLSVEGKINYSWCSAYSSLDVYMVTLIDVQVAYAQEEISRATGGYLHIRGKLATGYWDSDEYMPSRNPVIRGLESLRSEKDLASGIEPSSSLSFHDVRFSKAPSIKFDELQEKFDLDEDLFFLPVRKAVASSRDADFIHGLVLRSSQSPGHFTRVGVFTDEGRRATFPFFSALDDTELVIL